MPLRAHHLQSRSIAPRQPTQETQNVPFDDLVYLLAESVGDAQTKLDMSTAETITTLAETEVDVVPSLTRTIDADGTVTTETAPPQSQSLLEVGFTPSRYQFSDATVEVEVDISVTEHEQQDSERTERPFGLQAGTRAVIEQRKYDREISANARIEAHLQPTPLPTDVSPTERRDTEPGEENAN
jgi:hypothetical protein